MMRTSTRVGSLEPTRSKVFSCKTRSSLVCTSGVTSPISSRHGRLPRQLALQGQDAALLFGDLVHLGPQVTVEDFNGVVALRALQGQGGQLGEGGQQVEVFAAVKAEVLRSQDQQGQQLALVGQ